MNRNFIFSNAIILIEMWVSESMTVRLSIYDIVNFCSSIQRAGEEGGRRREREGGTERGFFPHFIICRGLLFSLYG